MANPASRAGFVIRVISRKVVKQGKRGRPWTGRVTRPPSGRHPPPKTSTRTESPMSEHEHAGPGYASPQVAREQPPEKVIYVASLYEGTGIDKPDFVAVVDVDPASADYGKIVHRTDMPNVGDELHHFGWNACSSACHSQLSRDTLIVPGFRSSRIHLLDISDPRKPTVKNVIEGEEIKENIGVSAPHPVHCMPTGFVTISILDDAGPNSPVGFAILDARDFSVAERWERD